jgi:hypothetical protein
MNKQLIKDIFDSDKDIHKYCDPDFITYQKDISEQIIIKIHGCLLQYPSCYMFSSPERKYFAVWLKAHNDWILYSFGVHSEKRDKENLSHFWNYLINEHEEGFISYLYSNNTRAIDWLKRMGMSEVGKVVERSDKIAIKLLLDTKKKGGIS